MVLPKEEILAIDYVDRDVIFNPNRIDEALKWTNESIGVHLFNAATGLTNTFKSEVNFLNYLGQNQCPDVFFTLPDYW